MQTAHFTGFLVESAPKETSTKYAPRLEFTASPMFQENIKVKLYFTAYGDNLEKIKKMKLRYKSCIDIICDMQFYEKDGQIKTAYKILDIRFSELEKILNDARMAGQESAPEKEEPQNEAKNNLMATAYMMASNPFA